ncbi:hypothetical protein KKF34_06170 [Myxococcota bacterium]|nr:hypothetical protein [Myxococcota bacterium]MBU1383028.1 hypothetical protein [Myxococcota bacterium]MBU1496446.1 hypothetical protein [Myxococcota bacterium]
MHDPVAVCLERVNPKPGENRFVQCTVITGAETGLGLDEHGNATWRDMASTVAEFFISADDRVMFLKTEKCTGEAIVSREGRSLAAPVNKPVVIIHGDTIKIADRILKIHLHGQTEYIHAPQDLIPEVDAKPQTKVLKAASLAAAIAATAVISTGCAPEKKGTDAAKSTDNAPMLPSGMAGNMTSDATDLKTMQPDMTETMAPPPMIEVRHHPPKPVMPRNPNPPTGNKSEDTEDTE